MHTFCICRPFFFPCLSLLLKRFFSLFNHFISCPVKKSSVFLTT
jgi:hypothetical protein